MKKLLLTALCGATLFGATAATTFDQVWQDRYLGAVKMGGKIYHAPVAADAAGNVVETGAFNQNFTWNMGRYQYKATGQSAYITKCDKDHNIVFSTYLQGAVTVADVKIAAGGDIYLAGTLADEVIFNSVGGDAQSVTGMMVDGAATVEQNASFIARYDATGKLLAVKTFVPANLPDLDATGMYYPMDGDVYFHINHLDVDGDKVYASALYTGATSVDGVDFNGSYNDPWGGVYFVDLANAAVFSLGADLSGCAKEVECCIPAPEATEDVMYMVTSVAFDVEQGSVYAAFVGNGPLAIAAGTDVRTLERENGTYGYSFVQAASGKIDQLAAAVCPEAGMNAKYVAAYVSAADGALVTVASEPFAENYGQDNERLGHRVTVFGSAAASLGDMKAVSAELVDEDINYNGITSGARLADGSTIFTALGYYTTKTDDHSVGDFADDYAAYIFDGSAIAAAPVSGVGIAASGECAIASAPFGGGAVFTYYTAVAGVADITVGTDANAPVEYYNLQGIRLDAPAAGQIVIRRQGASASRVLVK